MQLRANLQRPSTPEAIHRAVSHTTQIGVLAALSLILFLFEAAIPKPLPWLKPGLSNLITLVAFALYGFRTALAIVLVRVAVGALVLGTLFNPVFLFGLSGGLISTVVMGLFYFRFREIFSIFGVSISGAFAHNLVQISLAGIVVVGSTQVFYLVPIMLLSSLFSGILVGGFAHYTILRVKGTKRLTS